MNLTVISDLVQPSASRHDESQELSSSIRVGVDVIRVDEVESSIARFGNRYLRRIFTDHEIASCGPHGPRAAERLAARWAAKEAAIKVLRVEGAQPPWTDFEVRKHAGGWCDMFVTRGAARLAMAQGIPQTMSLSMTHEAGLAMAVVIAVALGDGVPPSHVSEKRLTSEPSYEAVC